MLLIEILRSSGIWWRTVTLLLDVIRKSNGAEITRIIKRQVDSRLFQKIQFYLKWVLHTFRNFYSSQCDAYRFSAHRCFCQCITLAWHHTAVVIYLHSLVHAPLMQIILRLFSFICPGLNLYLNRYCAKAHFSVTLSMSSSGSFYFDIFYYVLCWYVIGLSLRRTFWQVRKSFHSHSYVRYCSVSKSTHCTHKLMATWLEAIYSFGVVSCQVTCLSHSGWLIICHPYSLDWGPLF